MQQFLSFLLVLLFSALHAQTERYIEVERIYDLSKAKPSKEQKELGLYLPPQISQTTVYRSSGDTLYELAPKKQNRSTYKKWLLDDEQLYLYQSNIAWASQLVSGDYPYTKRATPEIKAKFVGKKYKILSGYTCRKVKFQYQGKDYEAYLSSDFPAALALPDFWIKVKGKSYALLAWEELGTANSARLRSLLSQQKDYVLPNMQPSFSAALELPMDEKTSPAFQPEAGKIHVFYYMGLHCEACFRDLPELVKLQKEFPELRFGIAGPSFASTWEALLKHLDINLPFWTSPWPGTRAELSPFAVLYDEQGELIYQTDKITQAELVLPLLYEAIEKQLAD